MRYGSLSMVSDGSRGREVMEGKHLLYRDNFSWKKNENEKGNRINTVLKNGYFILLYLLKSKIRFCFSIQHGGKTPCLRFEYKQGEGQ